MSGLGDSDYGVTTKRREARDHPPGERWCPDCQTLRPLSDFPKNRSTASGYAVYCKPCHNKRGRENRIKNHGSTRDFHLRQRYGIDSADVDRMIAAQGAQCAVCRKAAPEHVDHDHTTGAIRGILCFNCNQALGNARDNLQVLDQLFGYLARDRAGASAAPFRAYLPPPGITLEYDGPSHRAA